MLQDCSRWPLHQLSPHILKNQSCPNDPRHQSSSRGPQQYAFSSRARPQVLPTARDSRPRTVLCQLPWTPASPPRGLDWYGTSRSSYTWLSPVVGNIYSIVAGFWKWIFSEVGVWRVRTATEEVWAFRTSRFSRKTQSIGRIQTYVRDLLYKLAHAVMEGKKSHNLSPVSQKTKMVSV